MSQQIVFISLGGTKFELCLRSTQGKIRSSGRIRWREHKLFAAIRNSGDPSAFTDALAELIGLFSASHGATLENSFTVGVAFPGPCVSGRWYSNNLTAAFATGVELDARLQRSIAKVLGYRDTTVRIVFDAQCDAAGEIHHPDGALGLSQGNRFATVINIATGIAAGFVVDNRVLISDSDFHKHIGCQFDRNAGQLGRHLFYRWNDGTWLYQYQETGGIPQMPGCIRMTDYLSGPALAARLGVLLATRDLAPTCDALQPNDAAFFDQLPSTAADPEDRHSRAIDYIRQSDSALAGSMLNWMDSALSSQRAKTLGTVLKNFRQTVSLDIAAALRAWLQTDDWRPFGSTIVLAGGVGSNLFSQSDEIGPSEFMGSLNAHLGEHTRVFRSSLRNACEKEILLFLNQG